MLPVGSVFEKKRRGKSSPVSSPLRGLPPPLRLGATQQAAKAPKTPFIYKNLLYKINKSLYKYCIILF